MGLNELQNQRRNRGKKSSKPPKLNKNLKR
jgi:hypothetical protein